MLSVTGTLGQDNPIRYRGYFYDAETGFYYVSSRYYDPEVGRFISPDIILPLIVPQKHFAQYNLYAYCWNNPINMIDVMGHWPVQACVIGAAFGGVFGGLSALRSGDSVVAGIVTGAVTGAMKGLVLSLGLPIMATAVTIGSVEIMGNVVNQGWNYVETSIDEGKSTKEIINTINDNIVDEVL